MDKICSQFRILNVQMQIFFADDEELKNKFDRWCRAEQILNLSNQPERETIFLVGHAQMVEKWLSEHGVAKV